MSEDNKLLVSNYIESAKLAQRAIYFSFIFSASLCFAIYSKSPAFKVPMLDLETTVPNACVGLLALYTASGCVLSFAVSQCRQVWRYRFSGSSDLQLYPSLIHAKGFIKFAAICGPFFILMTLGQSLMGEHGLWKANLSAFLFSAFHIYAYLRTIRFIEVDPKYSDLID